MAVKKKVKKKKVSLKKKKPVKRKPLAKKKSTPESIELSGATSTTTIFIKKDFVDGEDASAYLDGDEGFDKSFDDNNDGILAD